MSEKKSEYFERNDMDDMWVCSYCGTEEVDEKAWVNMNTGMITEPDDYTNYWCNCCNEEVSPISYFEFKENIFIFANSVILIGIGFEFEVTRSIVSRIIDYS